MDNRRIVVYAVVLACLLPLASFVVMSALRSDQAGGLATERDARLAEARLRAVIGSSTDRWRETASSSRLADWPDLLGGRQPLLPQDADGIRPWMTFDYLNHVFFLPEEYLRQELMITSEDYPRETAASYARRSGRDEAVFMEDLRRAISAYLSDQAR